MQILLNGGLVSDLNLFAIFGRSLFDSWLDDWWQREV